MLKTVSKKDNLIYIVVGFDSYDRFLLDKNALGAGIDMPKKGRHST
jgi:hypothetical protein